MISAVQIEIRGYSSTIPANQSLAEGFQAEMLVVLAFCRWYLAFKCSCASTARSSTGSGDAPERTDDQGRWAEEHEHLQSQGVLLKDEDPVMDGKVEDVALVPQCGQDHHGEERPRLEQPVELIRIVLLAQPFRAAVVCGSHPKRRQICGRVSQDSIVPLCTCQRSVSVLSHYNAEPTKDGASVVRNHTPAIHPLGR